MKAQLSKWQRKFILDGFDDDLRIACTSVSAGKSYALSIWIVLQCLKNPGIRGIIIAQNYRALTLVLIREIKNRCSEFGITIEHNKSNNELVFPNGSILYGFSAESPDAVLGLTEISLLAIDEAAYTNEEIYNNARDRMRGSKYPSRVRLISSPSNTRVQNWFSALCKNNADKVIHATAFDNPFTSQAFKDELVERYGEGTPLYRQQVLGEIFDADVVSQIIKRSDFRQDKSANDNVYYLGMDCSGMGADKDVITIIDKYGIVDISEFSHADTFIKVNRINDYYNKYHFKCGYLDNTGGYGQGILDLCKSKNLPIDGINFANKAFNEELYPNARTEMYLEAAKEIKDGFYVYDNVKEEFIAQEITINNKGQSSLISKKDIKEVLGHSPDYSDAVSLALYAKNHGQIDRNEEYSNAVDQYLALVYNQKGYE